MKVVLAVVAIALATHAAPNIEWAQNASHLFLTFDYKCPQQFKYSFGIDTLSLECNGDTVADLLLRDDIKPDGAHSQCYTKRSYTECAIEKASNHDFDRLLAPGEQYDGKLKLDWEKFESSVASEDPEQNHEEEYEGSAVRVLARETYEQALKHKQFLVLHAGFPYCSSCSSLRAALKAVAKQFRHRKDDILFGYMDMLEHRNLRHKYQAVCETRCKLTIVDVVNEHANRVEWSATTDVLADTIERHTSPLVTKAKQTTDFETKHDKLVSVVLRDPSQASDVIQEGKNIRDHVQLFELDGLELEGLKETTVAAVVDKHGAVLAQLSASELATVNLTSWSLRSSFKPFARFEYSMEPRYKAINLPIGQLFLGEDDEDSARKFEELASEFDGQMIFLTYNARDRSVAMDKYGVDTDNLPVFIIADSEEYNAPQTVLYEQPPTVEQVREHIKAYLAGETSPSLQTSRIKGDGAVEYYPGLRMTSYRQLTQELMQNDQDILLVMYRDDYTPSWKKINATLQQLLQVTKDVPSFAIYAIKTSDNYHNATLFPQVQQYEDKARFYLFDKQDKASLPAHYKGKKSLKSMLPWLKKQSSAIMASWNAILDTVKVVAAQAKAEKEAARAEKEAKLAAAEKRLEGLEKVAITEDEGIVKHIIEAGEGDTPKDGAKIKAHYTGRLLDETVFDSSVERDTPFDFTLGQGQVIKCWDQGFATMTKGEKAYLTCGSEYAYGKSGSGSTIPPDATLRFEVELLDFTNPKDEL